MMEALFTEHGTLSQKGELLLAQAAKGLEFGWELGVEWGRTWCLSGGCMHENAHAYQYRPQDWFGTNGGKHFQAR